MYCWKKRLAIIFLLAAVVSLSFLLPLPASAATVVSADGWGWQNPLPQGNTLIGVWGSSFSDVFAVGDDGTILH